MLRAESSLFFCSIVNISLQCVCLRHAVEMISKFAKYKIKGTLAGVVCSIVYFKCMQSGSTKTHASCPKLD